MSTLATSLYGSSTSKGVTGLASGLDTDELVNQMAAATRNKINKQYQAKQKLLYKQTSYREVSSKLLSFSKKYLSYSSSSTTNILSPNFFKSNTIKSSSEYVNVTGDADNIKNFTIKDVSGVATCASLVSNKKVSSQSFNTSEITDYTSSLAGETLSIEYGEKTYNLTIDKDFGKILYDSGDVIRTDDAAKVNIQDVVDQLNKQLSTIKDEDGLDFNKTNEVLKYVVDGNQIKFNATTPDKIANLTAASTKILETLKMKVGEVAQSTTDIDVNSLTRTAKDVILDGSMTFDFNGVKKTINFSGMREKNSDGTYTDKYTYDAAGIETYLQAELNKAYGTNEVDPIEKINVEVVGDKVKFKTASTTDILGVSDISTELKNFTGIDSTTNNRVNKTKAIGEAGLVNPLDTTTLTNGNQGYAIKVNDKLFEFEKTATLSDIINTINKDDDAGVTLSYLSTSDTFTVKSNETGSNKAIKIENVGTSNLADSLFGIATEYTVKDGTDTKMTYSLNGVDNIVVTRSTANFTVDGINVELNEKAVGSITTTNPASFTVTSNSDEIVKKVKEFINDYNEIISIISTKTSEKPKKDYQPLTPEQKEEMKEDEIKDWDVEAKKGMLFGDSKLNSVLYSLRGIMSSKTSVSSFVLSDIGISVASFDTSGKLNFDEEKFKTKLSQDPNEVAALFTGSSSGTDSISGLSIQIQDILKKNVGISGTTGILIDEAGLDNSVITDQNFLSKRIKEYDKKLVDLKKDLEKERERYYKKFTALETAMSNLNSQSASLTNMMGSN